MAEQVDGFAMESKANAFGKALPVEQKKTISVVDEPPARKRSGRRK